MSTQKTSKINQLLQAQLPGTIFTSSWMVENGYSPELQKQYRKSHWLESIGFGAMKRTGENITIEGALSALQHQLKIPVHIGGKSALSLQGKAQYLHFGETKTTLFSPLKENLPKWFREYPALRYSYTYTQSNFLPAGIGMTDFISGGFQLRISSPVRAIMECLYLAPKEQSLIECYEIFEGLNNLRPQSVQQLLVSCNSVKVKRLFLFMAEKADHKWLEYIDLKIIDLGTGKRSIVSNGIYESKYQITIPKELKKDEGGI